jgi:hypothetical protein
VVEADPKKVTKKDQGEDKARSHQLHFPYLKLLFQSQTAAVHPAWSNLDFTGLLNIIGC